MSAFLSFSDLFSLPFVVVVDFEPKENVAGSVELAEPLLVLPNENPWLLFVELPNTVLVVPFDGLAKKSKLFPLEGAAAKPPKLAKTLGAPSYTRNCKCASFKI